MKYQKIGSTAWAGYEAAASDMDGDGYDSWALQMRSLIAFIRDLEDRLIATENQASTLTPDMQAELAKMRTEERERCIRIVRKALSAWVEEPDLVVEFIDDLEKQLAAEDKPKSALAKKKSYPIYTNSATGIEVTFGGTS